MAIGSLSNLVRKPEPDPVFVDGVRLYGGGRARRVRRMRRIVAGGTALLIVVLGVAGWFVMQRNQTTVVGLDQALSEFRAEPAGRAVEARAERPVTDQAKPADDPASSEQAAAKPAILPPKEPAPADGPYMRPAAGVYAYAAKGRESVSILGAHHDYPSEVFATVRHLDGCRWEHQNQVIEEHVDTRVLCSEPGRYKQIQQIRSIEFFGQREAPVLRCEPAQVHHAITDERGAKTTAQCTDGEGTDATILRTFEGVEKLDVGGRDVSAVKVSLHSRMSGKTNGTADDHLWIHPETGMTLRWDRRVDTMATAYGAQVHYLEDASFVLKSLDPRS